MRTYVLTHVNDSALLRDLGALASRERGTMAAVMAHLAEVDARRLYLPAGYPSMFDFCIRKLGWSEQTALKRLQAARAARRCPRIFEALAAGRLHVSAVVLLAPHLTPDNAEELLAAAAHRTKAEVEELLAQRFPRPDVPARIEALAPDAPVSPGEASRLPEPGLARNLLSPGIVPPPVDGARRGHAPASNASPLGPDRYALQFTIGRETYEKLRRVQALLSHQQPSGDLARIFDRALDTLATELEKRKFAATPKPRPHVRRASANARHIPASVKRAVWERDGGRCTFVSATGERCPARRLLEFDHIEPVARGGRASVSGLRLLCRGHNQYEADRTFGAAFMKGKRERDRRPAVQRQNRALPEPGNRTPSPEAGIHASRGPARSAAMARSGARPGAHCETEDVLAALRKLGLRAGEARRAAEICESLRDATVEERVCAALRRLDRNPGSGRQGQACD